MHTSKVFFICFVFFFCAAFNTHAQWIRTDTICKGNVNALTISGNNLFACTSEGVFHSMNDGTTWSKVNNGLTTGNVISLAICDTNILAGTSSGAVFRTSDNGLHWTSFTSALPGSNVNAVAVCESTVYAGAYDLVQGGGIMRSTDLGGTWSLIDSGLTNTDVRAFAFIDSMVFAGTMGGVFVSGNNSNEWVARNSGLTTQYVDALIAVPSMSNTDKTNLYAGTMTGGAFLSTDNGESWNKVNTGLTNTYVNAFAADISTSPIMSINLFAGTGWSGVFLSTNEGTNWKSVNTGLTVDQINSLAINSDGAILFAGTYDGVWRRPIFEMVTSVEEQKNRLAFQFQMKQNYPNPFNPTTTIQFTLPTPGLTTLKVYDLLGRDVFTLVAEERSAGEHTVHWNGSEFSGGIYFYTLQVGSYIETRKLVLLK